MGTVLLLALLQAAPAHAHNLGATFFAHTIEMKVEQERILVTYTVEIPTSVVLRRFWEFLASNDGLSREEKDRHITGEMLASLRKGLLLFRGPDEADLEAVEGVQEKTGLGDYNFFQYRMVLKVESGMAGDGKVMLVNRNFQGHGAVFRTTVEAGPGVRLTGCSLIDGDHRFIEDRETEQVWDRSEDHRAVEVRFRPARPFDSILPGEIPDRIDNEWLHKKSLPTDSGTDGPGKDGHDRSYGRLQSMLQSEGLGPGFVLSALAVAFLLGAVHAFSPGHGKSLMAAYLVGREGRALDPLVLGISITLSHVASIILLGVATLAASTWFVPEQVIPYIGAGSGVVIFGLGAFMLARRLSAAMAPAHDHGHAHHDHSHGHSSGEGNPPEGYLGTAMLGLSGGMVPCPSALAILLTAIAIGRLAFGMAIIVTFSTGLGFVLVLIGFIVTRAGSLASRFDGSGRITRWLPVASSIVILLLGAAIAAHSLMEAGILVIDFDRLPFSPY